MTQALIVAWVTINSVTLVLSLIALNDALGDRAAIRALNGESRRLTIGATVRRERLRVTVQLILLSSAIPSLIYAPGSERPAILAVAVVVGLMGVPVILAASSTLDARDRKRLTVMVAATMVHDREELLSSLLAKLDENTRISLLAGAAADAAYKEANSVNSKIAAQGAALVAQGVQLAERKETEVRVEGTIDETAAKVSDIHDVTVKNGGGK